MTSDSFAWQLTQLSTQASYPLLIITPHNRELHHLSQRVQFFNPSLSVLCFPNWETLTYERLSPSHLQTTQRLQTLHQLTSCSKGIIATTITALMQRLAPKNYLRAYVFEFALQDKIDLTVLSDELAHAGYQRVESIRLPGEFTLRGEIIEIFPLDTALPFRIHTAFTVIENLYYFDPTTKAPHEPIQSIQVIPTREFLLSDSSIQRFQQQGAKLLGQRFLSSVISQQLSTFSHAPGTEYYLPLFFETTQSLLDYLPAHTHWIMPPNLKEDLKANWESIDSRYHQLASDIKWPILPPEALYQAPSTLLQQLQSFKRQTVESYPTSALPDLDQQGTKGPIQALSRFLSTLKSDKPYKVLFSTTRTSAREPFVDRLNCIKLSPEWTSDWATFLKSTQPYHISVTPIRKGFWIPDEAILVISDTVLSERTHTLPPPKTVCRTASPTGSFSNLAQLAVNDPVVHIDHGIGRYLGLEHVIVNTMSQEFIVLAYADNTKLYVPICDIRLISPYLGQEHPSLNHLNSSQWKKTRQKALEQLKDTAAELLDLYAKRAQAKGEPFQPPDASYADFEKAFEFEETLDQKNAISAIIHDLCLEKPMDRLVCGDVGFGKTEVAMRAAFLAVQSNKQVAVLAPTTLLVDQHYRTFKERFVDWPISINWLSRFRTQTSSRAIKQALSTGNIDIIIGTQTLLSKQTTFKQLGLVIVDEEHHFGVQQKEQLTRLKSHVNVLTLSATPIPRTLQTTLSGLRDLSLITTPPKGRLSIKSVTMKRDTHIIQEAILRELSRGGQVYFVHNRITSLERVRREIQSLVPMAQIGVVHGELSKEELTDRMQAFYQQHYNLLVSTSIIETGLDIPTVNTLIVDRADQFGLAQLHQLRGRVGRSYHQAYAYFLVSDASLLSHDARKRLNALTQIDQLGSGFHLASQDLDIRGAGELLGDKQSGTVQQLGFTLYLELLQKTIQGLQSKQGDEPLNTLQTTLDLHIPAFIPASYLPDVSKRLQYYQSIETAATPSALNEVQIELIDRYGLLPDPIKHLFAITRLRKKAQLLGITKIDTNTKGGWIEFAHTASIHPTTIIQLIQTEPTQFKLVPNPGDHPPYLRFFWSKQTETKQKIAFIEGLLDKLEEN